MATARGPDEVIGHRRRHAQAEQAARRVLVIVDLIEAPAGKRPARVVADRINGRGPTALNEAHAAVQRAALEGMGMGSLAD